MKKIITLFMIVFLLGINFRTNAQNLIENWDGNGATGAGSEAGNFGWVGTPTVTWGQANVSGIRYVDNPTTIMYNGTSWKARGLYIRWDGTGGSSTTTVFSYPVTLEASKKYFFSGKFAWPNNSTAPTFTIGINSSIDNTGTSLTSNTLSIPTKLKLYDDTFSIVPVISGTYYLTIKSSTAVLGFATDLSILEVNPACLKLLNDQYSALSFGDISNVKNNLTLPAGTDGVTITWTSSNPDVLSNTGVIVSTPDKYKAPVVLTAKLINICSGSTFIQTKVFYAMVAPLHPPQSDLLAQWNFASTSLSTVRDTINVVDNTGNFTGKVLNEGSIRTIGSSIKYNVLDMGNNKGYFDMGKQIGPAIYSLTDYTMCAYFRVDSAYKYLANNGNFIWSFSNAEDQIASKNGYIIGRLSFQGQSVSSSYYATDNNSVDVGTAASQGAWHHMAYAQQGDSGKIFIDGLLKAKGLVTNLPSRALPKTGLTGTPFNWLGRSPYESNGDVYLRQTLLYDFELYNAAVTADDLKDWDVKGVITSLNSAYAEKPYDTLQALKDELKHLTLGDLSAVTSNVTLPPNGSLDPTISIAWSSDNTKIISNAGVITPKEFIDVNAVLTAVLSKGVQKVTKSFPVTVKAKTGFNSDLLLSYNFASNLVTGATVTDAAEKQFTGALKKDASVLTLGPPTNQHQVLNLGGDSSYFDMGKDFGKVIYELNDYSISVYFLVNFNRTHFTNNGNFIYTFSNSDKAGTDKNGYIFGRATNAIHCVSSAYYSTGNMATNPATPNPVDLGVFHHFVYTQNGSVGTSYLDGKLVSTIPAFTNTPSAAVAKDSLTGTPFNWLGRSNYVGDDYLTKTLISDFKVYKKALTTTEIDAMQDKSAKLNLAFIHDSIPTLLSEMESLDLGDLSHVTSDIVLPTNGVFDASVVITWQTSYPSVIGTSGAVARPSFLDAKVVLTATLTKRGQTLTKKFTATVPATAGYASDLLLNYNFEVSLVSGTTVTDAAEKHFTGSLMKDAHVTTIGSGSNQYNVLELASDSAYFDMGTDCGKLVYGLNDYSTSVFFLIDKNKTNLSASGNIIYTFSNSNNSVTDKNGYMSARATNAVHSVSSQYNVTGNMETAAAKSIPSKGDFHHLVFTQRGLVGTSYLDGDTVSSMTSFTNIPTLTLPKDGLTGTLYNWLGRSSYQGDAFLKNALVADFKLYKKALTSAEIKTMKDETASLDAAYKGVTPVEVVKNNAKWNINSSVPGLIQITGLIGNEKISVIDLLGRNVGVKNANTIYVRPGIYIVKVDNSAVKVLVK